MAEKMDVIADALSRYLTGFALSRALLEDYTKVVAKLENIPEQEVKDRVEKRANEIYREALDKQQQQTKEAMQQS